MQEFLRKYFGWLVDWIAKTVAGVHWRQRHPITAEHKAVLMEMLKKDYYIIATRHNNYLSTFAIGLVSFLGTGKWGFYSHVLMNLEDTVDNIGDFRFVEAVGTGSKYSTFDEVFRDPDAVCLLKPKAMHIAQWTYVLDKAKTQVGKPYDTLFDLTNDTKVSCVELVRNALSGEPNYKEDFFNFECMIRRVKNLTPQMFRDCPDFEPVYEIRGK